MNQTANPDLRREVEALAQALAGMRQHIGETCGAFPKRREQMQHLCRAYNLARARMGRVEVLMGFEHPTFYPGNTDTPLKCET
ncbi:MAG: hypothetical protein IMZ50_03315 [Candidatus Atribacteria bacterium]|nr:hypothetical protein [Candidatus Atribacteria bacterium]